MPNESDLRPEGLPPADGTEKSIDLFYIHPTGFFGSGNWNAALDPDGRAWEHARVMLATQASAFNGHCRVYAPRYRQATIASFILDRGEGFAAIDLAYHDVARAFEHYLKHENRGRPFVLAGHSQGSLHALRLIRERINGTPLVRRMVAAYLPGCLIPRDLVPDRPGHAGLCRAAADWGCVLSWNTYRDDGTPTGRGITWRGKAWTWFAGEPTACINPVTGSDDESMARAAAHRGSIDLRYPGELRSMVTGRAGGYRPTSLGPLRPAGFTTRCQGGFLLVSDDRDLPRPFRGGSFHSLDYTLFYGNIREDLRRRARAFRSAHP